VISYRDQGWSSHPEFYGTRDGSWSWTDFSLCTPLSPYIYSSRIKLFTNIHAGNDFETQKQYFTSNSAIFRTVYDAYDALLPGTSLDMLVWSRSAYPGWRNRFRDAAIEVRWDCNMEDIIKYIENIKNIHRMQNQIINSN